MVVTVLPEGKIQEHRGKKQEMTKRKESQQKSS